MSLENENLAYKQMKRARLESKLGLNKEEKMVDFEQLKQEKKERQKNKPDMKPDSLIAGWLFYIVIMIGGLIFNDYITIAITSTIIFFIWRRDAIERENGRK